jgi:hypothetical protein
MQDVNVLVLSAQPWEFTDDNGQQRSGISVFVSHLDGPQPERMAGRKPTKYTMPMDQYRTFQVQPLPAKAVMKTSFDFERQRLVPVEFDEFQSIA